MGRLMALQGSVTDSVVVGADGKATVTIRPSGPVVWMVSQVTNEMVPVPADGTIPAGADCNIRRNGYLVSPLVPNGDAAGGDPPIQLMPSDVLTVEWTGCTPGHVGKVLAIYDPVAF